MTILEQILSFIASYPLLGGIVLIISSFLEYVFPPFPGDTITLFGAFLVSAKGWNAALTFGAVTLGAMLGVLVDYKAGMMLAVRADSWRARTGWRRSFIIKTEKALEIFKKKGTPVLLLNRFIPGLRAFFFLAAGMSRMKLLTVMGLAFLSMTLWNLLIFGAGFAVGNNWEALKTAYDQYTVTMWVIMGVAAGLGIAGKITMTIVRNRRERRQRKREEMSTCPTVKCESANRQDDSPVL